LPDIKLPKFWGLVALLSLFFLIFGLGCVHGESIAISPAKLGLEICRGETAESYLIISNPSDQEASFSLSADDYPGWFAFSEPEGILGPGENREIKLSITPADDTANGAYDTLVSAAFDSEEPSGSVPINLATSIKAKITVTGKQVVSLALESADAANSEIGAPAVLSIAVLNNGNVRIAPSAEIILKKGGRTYLRSIFELPGILPGSRAKYLLNLSTDSLEAGDYLAALRLRLGSRQISESTLNLTLTPYGTFSRSGNFSGLAASGSPVIGQPAKIIAEFHNTASLNERAKLVAELFLDNTLVDKIESEELLTRPGETVELAAYFVPKSAGVYRLVSKIIFEGAETSEKVLLLDVKGNIPSGTNAPVGMMLSFSIASIGSAIYFRKEVKTMAKKLVNKTLSRAAGRVKAQPVKAKFVETQPVKDKFVKDKLYYCIDCNRPIKHKGRCMPCNMRAKIHREAQDRKYE
jgi:hypothetical protein